MRKYYEGKTQLVAGFQSAQHYQDTAAIWYDMSRDEFERGKFADASDSQNFASIFYAMARYKMGLQD